VLISLGMSTPHRFTDGIKEMSAALSAALALIVLGISGGAWRLWWPGGAVLSPAGSYVAALGALAALVTLTVALYRERKLPRLTCFAHPSIWAGCLCLVFISDWLCQRYALMQGPLIRGEILLCTAIAFVSLPIIARRSWKALPIFSAALLTWSFFEASSGRLLFSDDHAMFLFRLKQLREHFPFIPFWSPVWNAGIDARDFFATGALNPFIVGAPLIYIFGVEATYNVVVAGILFLLLPGVTYYASRRLRFSPAAASIASTLALCNGLMWYRWSLKYGTMGFVVSATLLPLAIVLALHFLETEKLRYRDIFLFVAVTTMTLLWSLAGAVFIPLALIAIPRTFAVLRSPSHLVAIALLAAVNLPWMTMMWKVSNVSRFITVEANSTAVAQRPASNEQSTDNAVTTSSPPQVAPFRHKAGAIDLRESLTRWQEAASSLNPLLVVFALPALIALSGRTLITYIATVGWLVALGTLGVSLKPQLELDRMLVIAAIVVCIPVGRFISTMVEQSPASLLKRTAAALTAGFLVVAPFSAANVLFNRSFEQYQFLSPGVDTLRDTLRALSQGGRVFFSGCVLHELSGGHLAPLPLWSETPMIASSYAHNIWRYQQPIPQSFIERGDLGVREYLDAMNVSLVVAHEPTWREFFSSRPAEFEPAGALLGFLLFRRVGFVSSYVLQGAADNISQTTNSVTLTPQTPRVVLKFTHFPFLTSTRCVLKPFALSPELTFIELRDCPVGQEITIKSVSPLQRLLS
jgi:hypothetical protein